MSGEATILVTDDDRRTRAVLAEILTRESYRVLQAGGGREALEVLARESVDVVLLDISMPEMDGLETTARIKSDPELKHIPVVIVTGLDDTPSKIEALKLGADDFLAKPPHMAEMIARVRSLVKVKAYHDHLLGYQKKLVDTVELRTRELQSSLTRLAEANQRLRVSSLSTIVCLSRAAEYRDEDTGAHIRRIGEYGRVLGRELGLGEEEQDALAHACPMHDIGKIGIPDRILLKPGRLDPEEWALMQQHTVFGGSILSGEKDSFLTLARTIALTHHERWDGSGYPNALAGADIPLAGRITAVADVFDALSSKRPYKEASSLEQAAAIVLGERGSHFDPQVADAFAATREEIFAIRLRYADGEPSPLLRQVEPGSAAGARPSAGTALEGQEQGGTPWERTS